MSGLEDQVTVEFLIELLWSMNGQSVRERELVKAAARRFGETTIAELVRRALNTFKLKNLYTDKQASVRYALKALAKITRPPCLTLCVSANSASLC